MPTFTHTATLPDGKVATRTTQGRVYTHAIATRPSFTDALARLAHPHEEARSRSTYRFYVQETGPNPKHSYEPNHLRPNVDELLTRMQHALLGVVDEDDFVRREFEKARHALESQRRSGVFDKWTVQGWAGNERLAINVKSRFTGSFYAETVILPATVDRRR